MTNEFSSTQTHEAVESDLKRLREELPAMANLVDAFGEIMVETARLKAELPHKNDFTVTDINPDKFRQGKPLAGKESFLVTGDEIRQAARRLIPAMEKGFPKIKDELAGVGDALESGKFDPDAGAESLLKSQEAVLEKIAADLRVTPQVFSFVMRQLVKPFVEKRAESIGPLPAELFWVKGYCPICGSWPSMAFLTGEGGQRWLRCSFCSYEWRFMKTQCPFCDNEDFETMEYFYSEDRKSERVDVCHNCGKYLVTVDLRESPGDLVLNVAALGMVYLDILAQEKGFSPGAVTEWNVLDG
ncbi:formate dehydrogenase accessory protein FdhE [Thermodesulfobacteriota bacterium]